MHTTWFLWCGLIIGGSRGSKGRVALPWVQFLFIFMQFLVHIMPNNRLALPELATLLWKILDPPLLIGHFTNYITVLTRDTIWTEVIREKKLQNLQKLNSFKVNFFLDFPDPILFNFFLGGIVYSHWRTHRLRPPPIVNGLRIHEPLVTGLSFFHFFIHIIKLSTPRKYLINDILHFRPVPYICVHIAYILLKIWRTLFFKISVNALSSETILCKYRLNIFLVILFIWTQRDRWNR